MLINQRLSHLNRAAALACGWSLTTDRHTLTTSVWLTGATTVKPFARFSGCLGCPLDNKRGRLWGAILRHAASCVPEDEGIRAVCADTTKTKAGRHIDGRARSRHGAGSARQAYRTLHGVNFVRGLRRMPLPRWPGHCLRVPMGLARSGQPAQAPQLGVP